MRPGSLCKPHGTKEFEREAVCEILIGQIQKLGALGGPGIVYQYVDPPKTFGCEVDYALGGIGRAQIQSDGFRDSALAADFGDGLIKKLPVTGALTLPGR